MTQLNDLDEILEEFTGVLKVLLQRATIPADECVIKMEHLITFGANFGSSMIKRMVNILWQEDMKFQRWQNIFGSSLKFLQKHLANGSDSTHAAFILQQMTLILQNILKNIPSAKVTCLQVCEWGDSDM